MRASDLIRAPWTAASEEAGAVLRYTVRRLLQLVLVLFVLSLLLFIWLRSLPGGPVTALLGERATPEKRAALNAVLGLDQPIFVQYFKFLGRVCRAISGSRHGVSPGRRRSTCSSPGSAPPSS